MVSLTSSEQLKGFRWMGLSWNCLSPSDGGLGKDVLLVGLSILTESSTLAFQAFSNGTVKASLVE